MRFMLQILLASILVLIPTIESFAGGRGPGKDEKTETDNLLEVLAHIDSRNYRNRESYYKIENTRELLDQCSVLCELAKDYEICVKQCKKQFGFYP